jgi:UDP-2-acetamido-3-amino-2,3-dideoxy-glucuronate N-acetyltransferase
MRQDISGSKNSGRIAVAGCGHWGKNLIRNLAELGHLSSICDSNDRLLQTFGKQYPDIKLYSRWEDALDDSTIDAVMIATPAEQHYHMTMAALRAGKDVFVEKPLALEAEDGMEMTEEARSQKAILMVGHLLRYHPAILRIQDFIADGTLGKLEYIYSNRLSMGKIRQEENALWSFAPHDISVMLAFVGQLPVQAAATGGAYLQPNIADVTVSNLLFDRGTRAHIFVSWLHPYKEHRLVVIGSKQMIVFEDSRATDKLMLFDKRIEYKNGALEALKPQGTPVAFDPEEPLRRECIHFVDCVMNRREPQTTGDEGVKVLQVLQACQRSLQLNGEPVQVRAQSMYKILAM